MDIGAEQQFFLMSRQKILFVETADCFVSLIFQHGNAAGVCGEFPEYPRQLLFGIVIRADIQNQCGIGRIVQKTLVAFIGFNDKVSAGASPVIAREVFRTERIDQSAGNDSGILPEIFKRFRQPCADAGFSAGARDCEIQFGAQFLNGTLQRDGAVNPLHSRRRVFEIGIVFLDRRGVDDCLRRETLIDGSVLFAEFDALCAERLKYCAVFRRMERPVTARDLVSEGTRHLRQCAHPDTSRADKMKFSGQILFHFTELLAVSKFILSIYCFHHRKSNHVFLIMRFSTGRGFMLDSTQRPGRSRIVAAMK